MSFCLRVLAATDLARRTSPARVIFTGLGLVIFLLKWSRKEVMLFFWGVSVGAEEEGRGRSQRIVKVKSETAKSNR